MTDNNYISVYCHSNYITFSKINIRNVKICVHRAFRADVISAICKKFDCGLILISETAFKRFVLTITSVQLTPAWNEGKSCSIESGYTSFLLHRAGRIVSIVIIGIPSQDKSLIIVISYPVFSIKKNFFNNHVSKINAIVVEYFVNLQRIQGCCS